MLVGLRPVVYHLVGPPGSGKRTVGLQLSRLTGAVLLDNHLFNDAVFKPYGADGVRPLIPEIHALASQVRMIGLEAARLAPRDVSQIFTSYLTNRPSGPEALALLRGVATARDAMYIPVWLDCDQAELERRMGHPDRLERVKLRDPDILRRTLAESGRLPPPPDSIVIDTSTLSPADAALLIASHSGALF